MKVKNFFGNTFAYPFSHGYLRWKAPRGSSANPFRVLFWQTARDISTALRCWLKSRSEADASYAKLNSLVLKKCGRVTDDLILRYLIDLNWRNADFTFPDKPALENRQTSRYLKTQTNVEWQKEYVHSRGWQSDSRKPDLFAAMGLGPHCLPPNKGGKVLARAFLNGRYIVRSRNLIRVTLSVDL